MQCVKTRKSQRRRVIFKEIYYTFTKNFIEQNFFPFKSYTNMSKGRCRRTLIVFELFRFEISKFGRLRLCFWLRLSSRAVLAVRATLQMIALARFHRDRGYFADQSQDSAPILLFCDSPIDSAAILVFCDW